MMDWTPTGSSCEVVAAATHLGPIRALIDALLIRRGHVEKKRGQGSLGA